MLLTGSHKSRAIFDRYNIIHEQELLDAGDQLVAYLAQQYAGDAALRRSAGVADRSADPTRTSVGAAAPRTARLLRLVRRTTA